MPLVVSPTLGFIVAFFLMVALLWVFRRQAAAKVHRLSRRMQLVSACMMAFAHGSNDAQKSMGIITLALLAFAHDHGTAGFPEWFMPKGDGVPRWVIVACAAAIGAGTMAGGKRIIKTMGTKIIRISARSQGFAAETRGRRSPSWGRATSACPSRPPTASTPASWASAPQRGGEGGGEEGRGGGGKGGRERGGGGSHLAHLVARHIHRALLASLQVGAGLRGAKLHAGKRFGIVARVEVRPGELHDDVAALRWQRRHGGSGRRPVACCRQVASGRTL